MRRRSRCEPVTDRTSTLATMTALVFGLATVLLLFLASGSWWQALLTVWAIASLTVWAFLGVVLLLSGLADYLAGRFRR